MLAQNFKTAADLGISEVEVDALIKVLGMLERDELVHTRDEDAEGVPNGFNMGTAGPEEGAVPCGTIACIGGWCAVVMGVPMVPYVDSHMHGPLEALYWSCISSGITPTQAATALRSYLTTGAPNWEEALTT